MNWKEPPADGAAMAESIFHHPLYWAAFQMAGAR
jgi:CHAT domain-containing protein